MNDITKILIIKPSSLGDVLHAFPAVTLLKQHYPQATIDWLVNPEFTKILEFHKDVDSVIPFPRKELGRVFSFFPAVRKLKKQLRAKHYDLVIDLQGLIRSGLATQLCNATKVCGFAQPKEKLAARFYDYAYELPNDITHAIEKNVSLINAILKTSYPVPTGTIQKITEYSSSVIKKLRESGVTENSPCIGIVAGARWESKKWPASFFADLIEKTATKLPKAKFIIIGAPSDADCAQEIIDKTPNSPTISMAGKTSVGELVELIRYCSVVVTNDSGPMHISAALGVQTIALFGPTDPAKTGPYGTTSKVAVAENMDCLRCLKRVCPKGTNECHNAISTDKASTLIEESLK